MKKLTALLLVLLLAVFAAACTPAAQPASEPSPEATDAPPVSQAPDAPVLTDPETGAEPLPEDVYSWPEGDAGLRVPEFNGGVIAAVLDNGDNCTITVTGADAEAYSAYVSELKEAGFTADVNEVKEASMHMYSAFSEDNYYASVAMTDSEVVISAEFLG